MNRAQGNTFWIVITAIIALVVLVILLLIFTGKTGSLESGLLNCESKGGFCTTLGSKTPNTACTDACGKIGAGIKFSECSSSTAFNCKLSTDTCCLGVKNQNK